MIHLPLEEEVKSSKYLVQVKRWNGTVIWFEIDQVSPVKAAYEALNRYMGLMTPLSFNCFLERVKGFEGENKWELVGTGTRIEVV